MQIVHFIVKGHWDLPRDGQEDSPLAATSSPSGGQRFSPRALA